MAYGYQGVKFKIEMIGSDIPLDDRLPFLKEWCKVFSDKELAPPYEGGSYGNLSFRLNPQSDEFIITAAHSSLEDSTTNDRFVTVSDVDMRNGVVYASGIREPSSESMVHYAIYHARPDVNAVFHGHCAKITQNAESMGVPTTSKEESYGTTELANRVVEALKDHNFLQMKNHGFLALGESLDDAGNIAIEYLKKC